jgi:hypothetical protein
MTVWKIKRPAGRGSFDVRPLVEDQFGVWLYAPRGSVWKAPHATGTLPFDALALFSPEQWWVAWWVEDARGRRIEIDVCLPPQREPNGWSYVDLELDVVKRENGSTEVLDRDEFDAACLNGWISAQDARRADVITEAMADALRRGDEPFGEEGWRRLRLAKLPPGELSALS